MQIRRPRHSILLASIAVVVASGCREELGPERFPTASVQGVIVRSGEPVESGWVEFQPAGGAVGNIRSARIEPDGTFRVDRVAIGLNVVRLVDLPDMSPGAAAVLSYTPPIRRTIPSEAGGPIRIDVIEELLLYKNAKDSKPRSATRAGDPRP